MSSSSSGHSHFEELCALASVGQVSPSEFQELSDHLRECSYCRQSYSEFFELTHQQLPVVAAGQLRPKRTGILGQLLGEDYKARFVVRAQERGMEISGTQAARGGLGTHLAGFSIPRLSYQPASIVVILTLLALVGISFHRLNEAEVQSAASSAQISKLSDQNGALEKQVNALSQRKQGVDTDLLEARRNARALTDRLRRLEEHVQQDQLALQEDKLARQNLNLQLNASTARGAESEARLRGTQQKLVALAQEIADLRARASRTEDGVSVAAQQVEIAELSRRAKEQEEVIDKQRKLLSVDGDVRDLMAARNLHITDVFDVDGQGKKKRAFGRVFYTEGRSLIFYAFDLDTPKVASAKHTFQAWGQLADASTSAVSLGIFYVDDQAQKRWMLKFDNPEVLAQISAVFVTAEPREGAARPTGQKLMYAYLGQEPNHP